MIRTSEMKATRRARRVVRSWIMIVDHFSIIGSSRRASAQLADDHAASAHQLHQRRRSTAIVRANIPIQRGPLRLPCPRSRPYASYHSSSLGKRELRTCLQPRPSPDPSYPGPCLAHLLHYPPIPGRTKSSTLFSSQSHFLLDFNSVSRGQYHLQPPTHAPSLGPLSPTLPCARPTLADRHVPPPQRGLRPPLLGPLVLSLFIVLSRRPLRARLVAEDRSRTPQGASDDSAAGATTTRSAAQPGQRLGGVLILQTQLSSSSSHSFARPRARPRTYPRHFRCRFKYHSRRAHPRP